MSNNNQDNICPRCHIRVKFLEIFKKCLYCSKKHCNQCWTELQTSDDYKILIDLLPKINNHTNMRRICPACIQILMHHTLNNSELKKQENEDDEYQLAVAMSLSQKEVDEKIERKRKFNENKDIQIQKIDIIETKLNENKEDLLIKTAESIERFMNRAKSNCELFLTNITSRGSREHS
jgi:hypothetical protein